MKQLFYITSIFLLSVTLASAQKPITISDDSLKFSTRYFPGFWVSIPEVKPEALKTSWIKAIQKNTKSKVTQDKKEMTLFGAILPDVREGNVNIMSQIADYDSLSRLFVSVETTRDNFIGRNSTEIDKLIKYLNKFAKEQYLKVANDQLADEVNKLLDLEKDLKSARKSKERFEKNIQSAKVRISEENDKIKAVNKELEVVDASIENSTSFLSTMEEGETKKTKQDELKAFQKKKKSFLKDINSSENSISRANNAIEDNKRDIALNDSTQKELGDKINQQKLVVAKFKGKIKTIESY